MSTEAAASVWASFSRPLSAWSGFRPRRRRSRARWRRAYVGNPSLNAQRASTRATDENVPRALSGYRPRVNATADVGAQYTESETPARPRSRTVHSTTVTRTAPRGVGVTVDQTLFNGFRTYNSVL